MEATPEFKLQPSNNTNIGDDIFQQIVTIIKAKINKAVWYVLFPIFLFGFFAGAWIF